MTIIGTSYSEAYQYLTKANSPKKTEATRTGEAASVNQTQELNKPEDLKEINDISNENYKAYTYNLIAQKADTDDNLGNNLSQEEKEYFIKDAFSYESKDVYLRQNILGNKRSVNFPIFNQLKLPMNGEPMEMSNGWGYIKRNSGTLYGKYSARYDNKGRMQSVSLQSANGHYSYNAKYFYSDNGEMTEIVRSNDGYYSEIVYNSDGTLKSLYESKPEPRSRQGFVETIKDYSYSFDDKGNPVQIITDGFTGNTTIAYKTRKGGYSFYPTNRLSECIVENYFSHDSITASKDKAVFKNEEEEIPFNKQIGVSSFNKYFAIEIGEYKSPEGTNDLYYAKYDNMGRLSSIVTKNQDKGNTLYEYTYLEGGEVLEMKLDYQTGKITESKYNYDGEIISKTEYDNIEDKLSGNKSYSQSFEYSQDEKGNPTQTMTDSRGVKIIETYNPEGENTKETIVLSEDLKDTFSFNGDNVKDSKQTLSESEVIVPLQKDNYDIPSAGEADETVTVAGEDGTYNYIYDSQGRLSKVELNRENGNDVISYSYGPDGEITEEQYNDTTKVKSVRKFDKNGLILSYEEILTTNPQENTYTRNYTYSYDENGNPIQIMSDSNGKQILTTYTSDGKYTQKKLDDKNIIMNAFSYKNASTGSKSADLSANNIVRVPISQQYGIPFTSSPSSQQVFNDETDNADKYEDIHAKYDNQGRLTNLVFVKNTNGIYRFSRVYYRYSINGEITETRNESNGRITEVTYNPDGTIKRQISYKNYWCKKHDRADIDREYSYSLDENSNPVQTVHNLKGVTVETVYKRDGSYEKINKTTNVVTKI